jgi:hypothetical protein
MKISLNLIAFIVFFLCFAWDMEHTHNFITWIYLLLAIINLASVIAYWTAELVIIVLAHYFKDNDKDT